jgi:ComF family protein
VHFTAAPVCPECLDRLPPLRAAAQCAQCGVPFENDAPLHAAGLCGFCRRGVTAFDWGRGFGVYEGRLRHLIHLLKYERLEPLARPLGRCLAPLLAEAGPVDVIVPVPLDRRRERQRGFNQAALIAAELSRTAGVPLGRGVLRRVRATETQTGLTRRQRRLNVRGAFRVRRPEAVAGRTVVLVDDVITTGATAAACAAALKRAGAARVVVLALARARRRIADIPVAGRPVRAGGRNGEAP